MMDKLVFIGKVVLSIIFIIVLFGVVKYADDIRTAVSQRTKQSVAGVQTNFEKEVKENVTGYTEVAKEQILNIKVADVVQSFSRMKKISNDVQGAREYVTDQVNGLLKREKK